MEGYIGQVILFAGIFAPRGWAFCNGQLLPIAQYSALFSLIGTTYGGDGKNTFGLPDLRGRAPIHFGQGPGLPLVVQGEVGGNSQVTLTTQNMPAHNHPITLTGTQVNLNTTVTGTIKTGATASGSFPATTAPVIGGEVTIPVNTTGGGSIKHTDPSKGLLSTTATPAYSTLSNGVYAGKGTLTKGDANIPQTPLNLSVSGSVNVPIQTTAPLTGTATTASTGSNSPVSIMSPYLAMNYCIALEGIYPSRS
jgi:microcystin-dependent protein